MWCRRTGCRRRPSSGNGGDHACRSVDHAHVGVRGDIKVPGSIQCKILDPVELRRGGGSIITRVPVVFISGIGADGTASRHLSDYVVILVADIEIAVGIHDDSFGISKLSARRRAAVA